MNKVKAWFTAFLSFVASLLGVLAIPVLILVSCNVIDYATGIVASKYRDEKISSYKSFRGIAKKICMWLLVVIGALVDQLLICRRNCRNHIAIYVFGGLCGCDMAYM